MRRAALLVLLTALLLHADAAVARVVATTHPATSDFEQGPSLEGGVLVWMDTACEYCHPLDVENEEIVYNVHVRYPGGRRAVLARGQYGFGGSGPNYGGEHVRFLASRSHLALEREFFGSDEFDGDYGGITLRAAPFGTRPARLFRCDVEDYPVEAFTALSGATLSYEASPCSENSALAVHDLATDERWVLPQSGRWIRALDIDGGFVAMATSSRGSYPADRVTVLDVRRRTDKYEVELPSVLPFSSLDVGADGSLAVRAGAGGESCEDEVAVYGESGAPAGRFAACRLVAQLAGRTVLVAPHGDRRVIVSVAGATEAGRTLVDLGRMPLKGADADGEQLTWVVPTCTGGHAIHLDELDGPAHRAGSPRCPAALAVRRNLAVSRDGRAAARVRCRRGCRGVLRLLAGNRTVAAAGFWAPPGGIRLRPRLRPWARERLARGPLTADARLRTRDIDGRPSVVTRSVTLAAP